MNNRITVFILLAAFALLALAGCNALRGSGNPMTQTYDFTDFDELAIEHAFEGTVTRGDAYSVAVTVDDNLVEHLRVRQEGSRVIIGFENTFAVTDADLNFAVTLPALATLDASGAANVQVSGFASAEPFTAHASGASRINGDVTAGAVDFNASGASTIDLTGQGDAARLEASGASTVDLTDFPTADTTTNASGASTIIVNTGGQLDAEASGASNVYYLGQPTMGTVNASGGSDVAPR